MLKIFFNSETNMGKRVPQPMLDLPDYVVEYPWVNNEVLGTSSFYTNESRMKLVHLDVKASLEWQLMFHGNGRCLYSQYEICGLPLH